MRSELEMSGGAMECVTTVVEGKLEMRSRERAISKRLVTCMRIPSTLPTLRHDYHLQGT